MSLPLTKILGAKTFWLCILLPRLPTISLKKHQNETLVKLFNIESKQNASSFEMRNALSNITTLESKVADNSKKGSTYYSRIIKMYCKGFL